MGLRPYQKQQLDSTKKDYSSGHRRLLVNAATGTGKTVYLAQLPKFMSLGGVTLVLVHREELATQAKDKIQKWNPDLKVGIEMADQYADHDCDVIVASVATIGREGSKRLQWLRREDVRLIITDEAHHSTASTYMAVYDYFGMFDETTGKLLVGVTATPGRGDGEPLAKVYQKITHSYSLRQAIEDGYLCDVRAIKLRTDTDISGVKATRGDFQIGDLSNAINTPERNQRIVKAWLDNAKGRPTIAFTADIQHAKDLAEMFERYGVRAAATWGNDPERESKRVLHERGQLDVICNCGIYTEGYDNWRISCIIMGRPTKSQTLFVQCIGRGTRLQEGVDNLKVALAEGWALQKTDCLVIDVVDSTSRNSLVTVPSIFGMAVDLDLKGQSAIASVRILEKAQVEHPDVDFSNLASIDQIDATVEDANIWDVKFPPEVEKHSSLGWHLTFDGSYLITLPSQVENRPSKDKVTIKPSVIGKWEVRGEIEGKKYLGERATLEEAFHCGDKLIIEKAGSALKILKREADWHDDPVSEPQKRMLKRLLKGRPIPDNLGKGAASKLIGQLMAAKLTGKKVTV